MPFFEEKKDKLKIETICLSKNNHLYCSIAAVNPSKLAP